MKVRRASRPVDLMRLPLDGFDMFLITRLDGSASTFAELADIAPCSPSETLGRLEQLERFGVIELSGERPRHLATPAHTATTEPPELGEDFVTLRPPTSAAAVEDVEDMVTLRPPKPVNEPLLHVSDGLSVSGVIQRAQAGIGVPSVYEVAQGTKRDPSVFSRATLVDEDGEERAKRSKDAR